MEFNIPDELLTPEKAPYLVQGWLEGIVQSRGEYRNVEPLGADEWRHPGLLEGLEGKPVSIILTD